MKSIRHEIEQAAFSVLHSRLKLPTDADSRAEQILRSKVASELATAVMRDLKYEGQRNAVAALVGSLPNGRARYQNDVEFHTAVDVIAQAVWYGGLGELPLTDNERAARLAALSAVVGVELTK